MAIRAATVSNYLIRGVLAAMPRGSTPERRWRMLFALLTVTPDAQGWRPIGMKLLGELARLSQPHLRQARDELVRDGWLEFNCDGKGHGARHYRWRLLVEELNPSGSTTGTQELNPNAEQLNPPSTGPGETSRRAFRAKTSRARGHARAREAPPELPVDPHPFESDGNGTCRCGLPRQNRIHTSTEGEDP